MVGRRLFARVAIVVVALSAVPAAGPTPASAGVADRRPLAVVSLGDSFISGNAGRWLGNSADNTGDRRGTDRAYTGSPADPYDPALVYGETSEELDNPRLYSLNLTKPRPMSTPGFRPWRHSGAA